MNFFFYFNKRLYFCKKKDDPTMWPRYIHIYLELGHEGSHFLLFIPYRINILLYQDVMDI